MYYVYILQSKKTRNFYKGFTNNLNRRLKQHFSGNVTSTSIMLPMIITHVQTCKTRKEARKLEKFFKSGYGREVIKEISEYYAEVAELVDA